MEMEQVNVGGVEDKVYSVLREMIITLKLAPNERLNINGLSHKLGVSITPIRAALHRLERDELVRRVPRVGFFVATINQKQVINIFQIRRALELLALESAIKNIDKALLQTLIHNMREVVKCLEGHEKSVIYEIDYKLHDFIIENSDNPSLQNIFADLMSFIQRSRNIIRYHLPPSEETWILHEVKQHILIAEYILHDDLEHAKQALSDHLNEIMQLICELLSKVYPISMQK